MPPAIGWNIRHPSWETGGPHCPRLVLHSCFTQTRGSCTAVLRCGHDAQCDVSGDERGNTPGTCRSSLHVSDLRPAPESCEAQRFGTWRPQTTPRRQKETRENVRKITFSRPFSDCPPTLKSRAPQGRPGSTPGPRHYEILSRSPRCHWAALASVSATWLCSFVRYRQSALKTSTSAVILPSGAIVMCCRM